MTTLRDGRYVLVDQLGAGAQGSTWNAIDKREGRKVAIKRFDVRGARQWKDIELAEREARVLSSLSHPKLPAYIDHFEENGALYLVMEKIEGTPTSALAKRGTFDEKDIFRLLRDADDILSYLHGRAPPVIHRDVKPSNVIQRPDGAFAFVDFGAVRERLRLEGGSTVVGTFGYMAPEQFQGRATPATDVYAVGATALTLLTGLPPEEWPHKGLEVDVAALLPGRDPVLRRALTRMLEPNPDLRPTRIAPLLEDASAGRSRPQGRKTGGDETYRPVFPDLLDPKFRERVEDEIRRKVDQSRAKAERRAEKLRRRGERHANRHAREQPFGPAWIALALVALGVLGSVGLLTAQVLVTFALRIATPAVLVLLAVVFGRGMKNAASRVDEAGARASDAIARAQARVRDASHAQKGGVRVSSTPPPRPRIVDTELVAEESEEAATEADHSSGKTRGG